MQIEHTTRRDFLVNSNTLEDKNQQQVWEFVVNCIVRVAETWSDSKKRTCLSIFLRKSIAYLFALVILGHKGTKRTKLSKLENVFVKHYAPNNMPDPKGEWSLKEKF